MPGSSDIGLGAVVSIRDQFTGPSKRITSSLMAMEKRFGLAAGTITTAAKSMIGGLALVVGGSLIRKAFQAPIDAAKDFERALPEVPPRPLPIKRLTNSGICRTS